MLIKVIGRSEKYGVLVIFAVRFEKQIYKQIVFSWEISETEVNLY